MTLNLAGTTSTQLPHRESRLIKDVLYEILYERFADQVTAKELLERVRRT